MITSPTGRNRPSGRPAAGFTLLELLAVMAVVGVMLALVSPSLSGFFASRQTADAATAVLALTQYASSQAVAQSRPYRLNIDSAAGTYWLTVQDGGDFVPVDGEMGQHFTIPDGGKVSIRQPNPQTLFNGQPLSQSSGVIQGSGAAPGSAGSPGSPGGAGSGSLFGRTGSAGGFGPLGQLGNRVNNAAPTYITFSSNRRSDPLTVELKGAQGEVYLLTCPSATEPFKVISPAEAN